MKLTTFFSTIFIIVNLISCSSNKTLTEQKSKSDSKNKTSIKISEINGESSDKAHLKSLDNEVYKIQKRKAYFADTLEIPESYYQLFIGKEFTNVYLKPGDNLFITLDANQFDETIKYVGKGAEENNYLAQKLLLKEKLNGRDKIMALYGLDENDFIKKWDSISNVLEQNFTSLNFKNKNFVQAEKKALKIDKAIGLLQYPNYHRYITQKKDFSVSNNFPDIKKMIDFNDESMLKIPGFTDLLEMYFTNEAINIAKEKKEYDPLMILQVINKQLYNKNIKERLVLKIAKQGINYTQNIKDYYNYFKQIVTDPKQQEPITKIYNNLKNVQPGSPSPDFTAYDINGKEYHLKDFAGKLLYIDLWATWCAPCRAEIPFLEKLKEEYKNKNITFLSISVWDQKDRWEKMVKSGKVKGWQLMSTDNKMDFLKKYVVTGIPRFILLDEQGKIINPNAPRPSNPLLKKLIDQYLK